ncbi:MAG TPA: dienelactone hydrolase family protein [Streptosporangiaceae bacterium]|nr:dienelactone hydrolase family protein [Streptosporangiaceae bacterium]
MNIATRDLSYRDLDTPLTGLFCWNEAQEGPRPGILLIHGGAGLDAHAREQACRYAALGYGVLACDMFGDGIAGDRERVMACLLALRDDPGRLVRRGQAGLTALADCPEAAGPAAAVGFCFGGMAALALARAGTNLTGPGLAGPGLAAVVSIHGSLVTSAPAQPGAVTARILACHGAADPHVPPADVAAFAAEMNHAGADWQLVMYGRAQHGFTHQHAVPGAMPGVAYDRLADERSFAAVRAFLAEALAP